MLQKRESVRCVSCCDPTHACLVNLHVIMSLKKLPQSLTQRSVPASKSPRCRQAACTHADGSSRTANAKAWSKACKANLPLRNSGHTSAAPNSNEMRRPLMFTAASPGWHKIPKAVSLIVAKIVFVLCTVHGSSHWQWMRGSHCQLRT